MTKESIFAGFGGQGVLMMGYVTAVSAMKDGKHVTYIPSYGAEVRGGTANCTVVVSDEEIHSPVSSRPDYIVVMNKPSLLKYEPVVKEGGIIFINSSLIDSSPTRTDIDIVKIPVNDIARDLGNDKVLNMIMIGAFMGKTKIISMDSVFIGLDEVFSGKKSSITELNRKGIEIGLTYISEGVKK